MAADYKFFDVAKGVDVTVVTDYIPPNNNFFVTDIIDYGTQDIMQGVDVGIEPYSERQFIDIAMDASVALYRVDRNGEFCLVLPGVLAGRFNGSTSSLVYAAVPVSTSTNLNSPLIFRTTIRMSEEDLAANLLNSEDTATLFTARGPSSNTRFEALLRFQEDVFGGPTTLVLEVIGRLNSDDTSIVSFRSQVITSFINKCLEFEFSFSIVNNTSFLGTVTLNDNMIASLEMFPSGLSGVAATVEAIYGFSSAAQKFNGIMRDVEIIGAGSQVVNTPDPSTGVNSAGDDGVATDITQITVIV